MTDPEQRFNIIVKKLKAHGHKLTPQRLAVARVLAASEGHPDVETIYQRIRYDFPTMSLATVYRNVVLLKSLGEVLELGFPDASNRYDGNKPHPHPHLICVRCRRIIDPDIDSLTNVTRELVDETGFEILTHRLDFFGICPDCQEAASKGKATDPALDPQP